MLCDKINHRRNKNDSNLWWLYSWSSFPPLLRSPRTGGYRLWAFYSQRAVERIFVWSNTWNWIVSCWIILFPLLLYTTILFPCNWYSFFSPYLNKAYPLTSWRRLEHSWDLLLIKYKHKKIFIVHITHYKWTFILRAFCFVLFVWLFYLCVFVCCCFFVFFLSGD